MAKPITFRFLGDAKGLIGTTDTILGRFGKLTLAGTALGAGLATALGVSAVRTFQGFDEAMVKSQAIMGELTDVQMQRMEQAARSVATTTTFSAEQAAESYFFLASAGLSAEQSIAALPRVARFAQAGAFDMATATDLLTDAQSALGLSVDDTVQNMENMNRVSDVLVQGNILANASVEQFSTALTNKAGPALKQVGKDVEEGVAVLAAFADQGIKGEQAGTLLGIVMRDLQTKAIANKSTFEQFNVAVFDAQGEMRNMADITADLENALAGMSDEQKKATLTQLGFSDKSQGALSALIGSADAIAEYEAKLREASGTTDEVANNQLKSMTAQFQLAKSRIADVGIELGGMLAPHIVRGVTVLTTGISAFVAALKGEGITSDGFIGQVERFGTFIRNEMIPRIRTITGHVREFAEVALPKVASVIRGIVSDGQDFIGFLQENDELVIGAAAGITALLVPGFVAWAASATAAAVATVAANAPLVAMGVVIGGTVALVVRLYRENERFRDVIDSVGRFLRDSVLPTLERFGEWIWNQGLPLLGQMAMWLGEKLVGAGQWAISFIDQHIIPWLRTLTDFVAGVGSGASSGYDAFKEGLNKIKDFAEEWVGRAQGAFDSIKETIIAPFRESFSWIREQWRQIADLLGLSSGGKSGGDIVKITSSGGRSFARQMGGPIASDGFFDLHANERVFLPRGAMVKPAHKMEGNNGAQITINAHTNANAHDIGSEVGWALATRG